MMKHILSRYFLVTILSWYIVFIASDIGWALGGGGDKPWWVDTGFVLGLWLTGLVHQISAFIYSLLFPAKT